MDVKKGKGLVQKCEGFKTTLDEKIFEINYNVNSSSKIGLLMNTKSRLKICQASKHIEKLEATIVSLKNK